MSKRPDTLQALITLGRRNRDDAAAALAGARRHEHGEQALLRQLSGFQEDYRQASPKQPGRATVVSEIENHQRFADRLDQAVRDQLVRQQRAGEGRHQSERVLQQAEQRLRSFEKLQEHRARAAALRIARREQRATDEQAALIARRKTVR